MEYTDNTDFAKEKAAGKAVARFYRELALFQVNAICYVARGKTTEDKNDRIAEIIEFVGSAGVKADDPFLVLEPDHCQIPPCRRDEMGICVHD